MWVAWLLPHMAAAQARPHAGHDDTDAIYAYTDHKGQLIYAASLQDIPLSLREFARRVDAEGGAPRGDALSALPLSPELQPLLAAVRAARGAGGEAAAHASKPDDAGAVVYRYRGPSGPPVYTNILDAVPLEQRARARVDLSRVTLNSPLGRELDAQLDREHERLKRQPLCQQLVAAAGQSLAARVWHDHGPLVVCGAAIAGFVLLTPWALRRVGGQAWARTLTMAVPALGIAGLALYTTLTSARQLRALKERAGPCDETTWNALKSDPSSLLERLHLLDHYETQRAALERIDREGD